MAGQISLMQGPLGVASSARRAQPRPGSAPVKSASESNGASLDRRPSQPAPPSRPERENTSPDQTLVKPVAPGTLFEASRIATVLTADAAPLSAPGLSAHSQWNPPYSTFHLRDRTV